MSETETEQDTPFEEPGPEPAPDEQEQDDAEAAEEEDATPEPEPVDEDRSKMFGKIDRSFTTYKAAVERNLEEEVLDWMPCPLCYGGGVPGFMHKHDLGRVPEDVQTNVMTFLGFAREQEYEQDPNTRTCPTCNGKTKVKSGATDGDYIVRGCPECKGYGFVPPPGAGAILGAANGTPEQAVAQALAEVETPERDNWGEPRVLPDGTLNSNYGKMPQFKQVHPVYGVTANLSPEELVSG